MQPFELTRHLPGADVDLLQRYRFDLAGFLAFRDALRAGACTRAASAFQGDLQAPRPGDVAALDGTERALQERGEAALAAGQVAVVVLAGGMATRFRTAGGPTPVKATVEVAPGKSFLQFKLEDARAAGRRYGRALPFCVMGSFATLPGRNGIERHLVERGLWGGDIVLFAQRISVRLTPQGDPFGARSDGGPLPWESYTTPGHGDVFAALRETGVQSLLARAGVRVVLLSNVDNLGATVDPRLIGLFLEREEACGAAILAETVARQMADGTQVGVVVRADNRLRIVEGFRVPDGTDPARLTDAAINSFCLSLPALAQPISLEVHAVEKLVGGIRSLQGETIACEATALLPMCAVRVPREGRPGRFSEGRFYPVKSLPDLERIRGLLVPQPVRWVPSVPPYAGSPSGSSSTATSGATPAFQRNR